MSNTEQKQKILLKRTTEVDKQPIPSDASHGELFLNIASGANAHNKIATMQIGTNEAIIWSDDAANEKKFALKTELENLIQEVEDSEFVTANALTQINKSAGFTEGGISKLPDQQSLTDAIIDLQNKTQDLEESDPIFTDSPAAGITDDDIENWNNKLDKDGKAVSAQTADFATELTGRLEATSEAFTYRPSAGDKSIKDDNAFIRRVKGNSVVFNQLVKDNGYSNNGVVTTFNNGVFTLAGTPTSTYFNTSEAIPLVLGHTMLLQVFVVANPKNVKARFGDLNQNAYIPIDTGGGIIYTASGLVNHYLGFYESNLKNIDFTGLQIFQMLVDLTAMFGAGNEPTTVEEFRALYPNSYYPYNPGELRNFVCSGIKTVGFNQWDEQWEIGYISIHDGINAPSTTCIRSANFIKCLPDTEYSATKPTRGILIAFYDFSKQYIGNVSTENLFTTPTNCAFIRFFVEYGTTVSTYNHDICINLHHTGYRDGEYEPYKEVTHALPLSQITNGEPLRKAGSVYDEINETEYIKRVGVVDLGSLTWWQSSSNKIWKSNISTIGGACYNDNYNKNLFCARYKTAYSYETNNELVVSISWTSEGGGLLFLCDPQYDNYTVNEFKASLSGVLLQYELAEPIVTPIETPIDFNYYVEDFGTEEAILAENSAPFNADIIYQFNAVDRIRQNDLNIDRIEKELLLKSDTGHTHSEYATTTALNDLISDIEDNKLDKDGKAVSAQTADFATDLSGRVEATPELFTYRPSAGDKSIKDDNAFIRRVKGNSVVFNQILAPRSLTETSNGITVTQDGTGKVVVKGTATSRAQVSVGTAQIITGHKYAYWGLVGDGANKFYWTDQTVNADTGKGVIAQPTYASGERYFILNVLQGVTVDFTFYPQVSDLTAMFGAGNEPTTVEEFRALYPNSYYPYNPGELRNLACSGIKTVGFNQWDEQWERGTLSSTGQNDNTSTTIRSKNYIPVIGNEDYYVGITTEGLDNMYYLTVCWYDSNKNFISKIYCNREVVTSPVNAAYMRFGTNTNTYIYGITYNHDICINLHHTGYRDGEYEPYKEVTHALPLSQITNGEPLRKAGSVYDEINETHYIKRVGVVDLGSLTWVNAANNIFACTEMPNMIVTTDTALRLDGLFCTKYAIDTNLSIDATMSEKTMKRNNGWLYIKDTSFTDVASFKASLSGVMLNYELAEPIVTPIETPIDFNYYVEDFGTEEAILTENSAPFNADIIYQFNAVDRIRQNDLNIDRLEKELLLKSDSPVIKGTATNSAVLNGTYLERDNQAISQLSMATGAGANAGLKGYYYEGIDFTNKKIYLSNKTTLPTTIKTSGFDTYSNFSCGYSVEDVISIVNGKKYDRCSKITAISNNVITLDSLPFTQDEAKLSLLTDTIGEEIPNEFSVNVVKRLVDDYDVLSVTKHNVGTVDLGGGAHAEGVNTFATNIGAHAEGFQTLAYGQASHAEGMGTQASYTSHAEGYSTQATGDASHAEGKNTIASGDKSHAEGYGTRARGHHSHAEGVATIASGTNAHAEGDSTTASGYASHAEGISTIASGTNAHAEGELAQAIGNDSHAEGYGTQAIGSRAHAEGDSTQAIGKDSHAGGNGSIAEGDRSFAHGDNVRASGANALALGKNSIAAGHNSIAAGHESQTNNTRSFAMGYICKTEGNDSMAFGYECSTAAAKSAAIGNRAKSTNIGEFACGSYNATGDTQLFSVGCGTSDTSRKNAFHITNSNGIISAYVNNKKISTEGHKHSPAELGLESALKYHGVTTTPLTDGATTKPITIGGVSHYQSAGCVVIYTTTASGDTEFVWNGSSWEKLGDGINYKVKQEAVSDPAANGSALAFIDTISQDTNGVIKPTKKSVNLANYSLSGHNHDTVYWKRTEKVNSATTTSFLAPYESILDASSNDNKNKGYFCYVNPDAGDINVPRAGILTSFRDSQGCATQFLSDYKYDDLYYRSAKSDTSSIGTTWTDWHKIAYIDSFKAGSNVTLSQSAGVITINATDTNTDTKVTAVGNHYTPSSSTTKGTTATTSNNYIKGIRMDAKGHVTDVITGTVLTSYTETYKGTITGVTAGTGLTGGGSQSTGSKSVTLSISSDYQNKIASGVSAYTMVKELIQDIEDNELVIAAALNHMNASAGFDNLGQSTLPNKQSLTDAIVELKDSTGRLNVTAGTGAYRLVGVSATATKSNLTPYINSAVYMENGSIFAASDRTLKTHIEDVDGSLDKIKRIPKVYFHWNNDEDKKRQMGTYAQDLEEVYPELVTKDKDGIRAVAYDRLGVVALAGIDKLYDMVQELMKKNDELEKRIKELEENK